MFEEKNNNETNDDNTPIDPSFLAQINKKCAHYRSAAIAEKAKKEEASLEFDQEFVNQAKKEHNEESFPAVVTPVTSSELVTVFNTMNAN